MIRTRALLAALFVLPFAALAAPPRPNLDVRPLVRMRTEFFQIFPETGNSLRAEVDNFISRGGYVFSNTHLDSSEFGTESMVGRGFAEPDLQEILRQSLTRSRIGFQESCYFLSGTASGFTEVAWYGREGRVNTFRVTTRPEPDPASQPCAEEVRSLFSDLDFYIQTVVAEDELFRSP